MNRVAVVLVCYGNVYCEDIQMSSSDKGIQYGSDLAGERQQALRESGSMDAGFQEMADNVYAHLKDEISKKIFDARMSMPLRAM